MGKLFIYSDSHFGHANIIHYANRPYASVEEMNEDLIKRWNETVSPDDMVIHLGDFGFGPIDRQRRIFERLNGEKRLILGNHDGNRTRMERIGFIDPVKSLDYKLGDTTIHMVHNPANARPEGQFDIVLYGHLHNTKCEKFDKIPTWVNCCVENWDYRPIDMETIITTVADRILLSIPGFEEFTRNL